MEYQVGDSVKISFHNPFSKAFVLLIWGHKSEYQKSVTQVGFGENVLSIVLGKECSGVCSLEFVLASGVRDRTEVAVPVSHVFDFAGPATVSEVCKDGNWSLIDFFSFSKSISKRLLGM